MDYTAWITLSAVIIALGIGVASIIHTEIIQKREQRRRLLNEIAEWATKVTSWRSENRAIMTELASIKEVRQSKRLHHAYILEIINFFAAVTGLNMYISKVSLTFQQGLPEVVQKLIADLNEFLWLLVAYQIRLYTDIDGGEVDVGISEDPKWADEFTEKLEKSAGAVLEKVADIKTKGLGGNPKLWRFPKWFSKAG